MLQKGDNFRSWVLLNAVTDQCKEIKNNRTNDPTKTQQVRTKKKNGIHKSYTYDVRMRVIKQDKMMRKKMKWLISGVAVGANGELHRVRNDGAVKKSGEEKTGFNVNFRYMG